MNKQLLIGDSELFVDSAFCFDYKISKVGLNENAHIITNLNLEEK